MLVFAAAVFFLIVTPGPGVLSLAGVGSGFGYRAGLIYLGGLFAGTNLVAIAVVTGAAAFLFSVPYVREALLIASAAYLCYLALKIAFSGSRIAIIQAEKAPGFVGGLALQAINPKAYAVNTALFTGFPFWPDSLSTEILLKFLLINVIWLPIHVFWLMAGVTIRRLELPQRTQFFINVLMASSMLAVVALAAFAG